MRDFKQILLAIWLIFVVWCVSATVSLLLLYFMIQAVMGW